MTFCQFLFTVVSRSMLTLPVENTIVRVHSDLAKLVPHTKLSSGEAVSEIVQRTVMRTVEGVSHLSCILQSADGVSEARIVSAAELTRIVHHSATCRACLVRVVQLMLTVVSLSAFDLCVLSIFHLTNLISVTHVFMVQTVLEVGVSPMTVITFYFRRMQLGTCHPKNCQ